MTKTDRRIYAFCARWYEDRGFFPSLTNIVSVFGFNPNTARSHLVHLVMQGYVSRPRLMDDKGWTLCVPLVPLQREYLSWDNDNKKLVNLRDLDSGI